MILAGLLSLCQNSTQWCSPVTRYSLMHSKGLEGLSQAIVCDGMAAVATAHCQRALNFKFIECK